jgi:NtrC-family two-component system sensor histidine kinase KinB
VSPRSKRFRLSLRARFLAAGATLVLATIASGVWSAFAFARLARVVDSTLIDTDRTTGATAALTNELEREDDALLLCFTGDARAAANLAEERAGVAEASARLDALLTTPREREISAALRDEIAAYETAGDRLRRGAPESGLDRYHGEVNPLLRRAVATAGSIRDEHFRSTQRAAAWARDEARWATGTVSAIALVALALSIVVALRLARGVVWPLRELMTLVDAIRQGNFDHRVPRIGDDELGRLGEGVNKMAADVAEFRRSNLGEVLRAKRTLESVLAALPDAVLVIDAEGRVSSANAAATAVLASLGTRREGAATRERQGRITDVPLPAPAREVTMAALAGDAAPASIDLDRTFTVDVAGVPRRLLPRALPISAGSDDAPGAVLVLSDVTELARLDEMRVEHVAVASHELRTPLTTLRMTLLMLEEGARELGPRDQQLVATALLGVDQLTSTVDEFLDLARIEAGQLQLAMSKVCVATLVARAVAKASARSEAAGVVVRTRVVGEVPAIDADAARLDAVLGNLLDNALKYTPPGGVIEIAVSSMQNAPSTGADLLQIAVTDSGPGVPAEFRLRVFDKFFRVEHQRPAAGGEPRGAGIGLYLARQIVEAHAGTIRCDARPSGGGASFVIALGAARRGEAA